MKRTKLKAFRIMKDLTQEEMGKKLGCSGQHYGYIEQGTRQGTWKFWQTLKVEFNLSASEIWALITNE